MKLSIITQRDPKRKASFLVVIPARLSPTGKRQYKRFEQKAQAQALINTLRASIKATGENVINTEAPHKIADAAQARALLSCTGLTLTLAAEKLLEYLNAGFVANTAASLTGARGAGNGVHKLSVSAACRQLNDTKRHQSTHTITSRAGTLNRIFTRAPRFADMDITAVTAAHITAALDKAWPDSPPTWNQGRKHLAATFAWALRKEIILRNPMLAVDIQHVQEKEITALHPKELRALFAACRPPHPNESAAADTEYMRKFACMDTTCCKLYIAICAFAGVRPAECARLTWEDICLEDNILSIRSTKSKTGGVRHIDLHPTLRAWILSLKPSDAAPTDPVTPLTASWLANNLRSVRIRAGFTAAHPWQDDCLRHSYATYYLKAAAGNIQQLQWNMGHSNAKLIYSRYVNMAGVTKKHAQEWWSILP